MKRTGDVGTALQTAVSWSLPGHDHRPLATDGRFDQDALVAAARHHRVSGIVLDAARDGALPHLLPSTLARLGEHHEQHLHQSLLVESDLVRCADVLHAAGVEHRALKGLATAHLDYDDPASRITRDVDILVRGDGLAAAVEALAPLIRPAPRASAFDRHFGKDLTLRLRSGGWLDLHRLIAPGYWGLALDHDLLFADPSHFTVAGVRMSALSTEHRFVHAVLHIGCSDRSILQSVRDIPVIAAALGRTAVDVLDHDSLRGHRGALARGLTVAAGMIELDPMLRAWADRCEPTRRERLALRLARRPGMGVNRTGPVALAPSRWPRFAVELGASKSPFRTRRAAPLPR